MRFSAFTLIEGIVSMVLLSLLLSIGVLTSFNLYKSLPRERELDMDSRMKIQLDSLIQLPVIEPVNYQSGAYEIVYQSEQSDKFQNMRLGSINIRDSLGLERSMQKLFLYYED